MADTEPEAFVAGIEDESRRCDAQLLLELMGRATGEQPVMWGSSIVGFGAYHYLYESGREGDTFAVGFSPRKQAMTIYLLDGFEDRAELLGRLGAHRLGKGCLYLKRVGGDRGVDLDVLEELVRRSYVTITGG